MQNPQGYLNEKSVQKWNLLSNNWYRYYTKIKLLRNF